MADRTLAAEITPCAHCGKKNRIPAAADGTPSCGNCHKPLPWVVNAGDQTFGDVVERAGLPVLVDFWAPWCGPCRMVSPALEQIATELAGRIKLVKVNVDSSPALQQRFSVQSIPTLMVFRQGKVAASQIGAAPADRLRAWVNQALGAGS
jgi:thioredoxin 2